MKVKNTWSALVSSFVLVSSAFAAGPSEQVTYRGQAVNETVRLEDKVSEPVYEERDVPSTCYREEITGYRQECTTTYETECRDETRRECRDTTRRECRMEQRQQCSDTTRRECHNENRRECNTEYRRECRNEQQCRNVPEQVCRVQNGQRVCQTVQRRVCDNRQVCREVPHQVCRDRWEQVCRNVPDRICRTVEEQVCRNVPDQICSDRIERVCRQVPRQTCRQVPVIEQVPYACTRRERVQTGERITKLTEASVALKIAAAPAGLNVDEEIEIALKGAKVELSCKNPSGNVLLLATQTQSQTSSGPNRISIQSKVDIRAVGTQELLGAISQPISQVAMSKTSLTFVIGPVAKPELVSMGMHLVRATSGAVVHSAAIPASAITMQTITGDFGEKATRVTIAIAKLTLREPIAIDSYSATLAVRLDPKAVESVVNRQTLPAKLEQKSAHLVDVVR